jgi:signal transduction histidine kinase
MWIDIRQEDSRLWVDVRDDGQGFEVNTTLPEAEARGSLGMIHMRESAGLLQGTLRLHSVPGKGATVGLTVPLEPNLQR